jgi:cytochrome c
MKLVLSAPVLALITATAPLAASESSPPHPGADLFTRACGTCHTVAKDGEHRQGPNLWNIVGAKSAAKSGFAYSAALAAAGLTWSEANLDRWLEDPAEMIPGSVMAYAQRNPDRRALIIDFLKTLK